MLQAAAPSRGIACYTIAFTLRSGSNLLCDYLALNGLGLPTEYFQWPLGVTNRQWYDLLGVEPDDLLGFLDALVRERSQNQIFGAKLTWDHKNALLEEASALLGRPCEIHDLLPGTRWIYLEREDRISQAISLWRATKTNDWGGSSSPETPPPEYDFFGIFTHLFSLLVEDHMWRDYFARHRIEPLQISYESFSADPRATLAALSAHIRPEQPLLPEQVQLTTRLRKQRDWYTDQLYEQFTDDLYHIGAMRHWEGRSDQLQNWVAFFQQQGWKEEVRRKK
ncbi:MAG: hypothetical protein OHK0022_36840 [Roseiflexaceae bacterium]